ncbi:MAG: FAD:protein FMN transferase [Ignavibacteriae bacterium]|nr:FAD:protein FMN transferase [Ignavibacteriota bacterium]
MLTETDQFILSNNILKFSHQAMNTIFDIYIANEDKSYAQQAAYEAFNEIDRLENELSRFKPNSDINRINNLELGKTIIINEDVMNCLVQSKYVYELTKGIFDITLGKSIQNWKENQINNLDEDNRGGFSNVILDKSKFALTALNPINIDLGGIGKGYAADKVAKLLNEWEIKSLLINAGGSTTKFNAAESNIISWPLTISNPMDNRIICNIKINSGSLSSSGIRKGNHIINPIDFHPVNNKRLSAWAYTEDATLSDALSTSFMILDFKEIRNICDSNDSISSLLIESRNEGFEVIKFGNFFEDFVI